MVERPNRHSTRDGDDVSDSGPIYDESYGSEYADQDEITGHYSCYFKDNPPVLPSRYLERDVDSYVDCNGDG